MSMFIRSILVGLALLGTVSAASATYHGHGWGSSYYAKRWVKVDGKWKKHDTRAFFEQLKKNNGS